MSALKSQEDVKLVEFTAKKPSYEVGASMQLPWAKKVAGMVTLTNLLLQTNITKHLVQCVATSLSCISVLIGMRKT